MKHDINPAVLTWARKERGLSIEDLACKISKDVQKIRQWENDGKDVTLAELGQLSKACKRQRAVFFLIDVPKPIKRPKYRNLRTDGEQLSPEVLLSIRRTSRYIQVVQDLMSNQDIQQEYNWLKMMPNNSGNLKSKINFLRRILDIDYDNLKISPKADVVIRLWRQKFEEKLGIYVFKFPIPKEELDGFSYTELDKPYAIVVNSRHNPYRQVFTLFHELGHILFDTSSLCSINQDEDENAVEVACNKFAANFLMPSGYVDTPSNFDELSLLARRLGVSKSAYLIRLKAMNKVNAHQFQQFQNDIKAHNERVLEIKRKEKKKAKEEGNDKKIDYINVMKSYRGNKFFNLIVDSYYNQLINATSASDLLGIRPTKL